MPDAALPEPTPDMTEDDYVALLRLYLRPDFLATLQHVARAYGHTGDFVAIRDFVAWVADVTETPRPDLTAYSFRERVPEESPHA